MLLSLLETVFGSQDFSPHGFCLAWNPVVLGTHVASDLGLALSYIATAGIIFLFGRKRPDVGFSGIFHLLTLVFALCGLSHLSELFTIWWPLYGIQGLFKAVTAILSVLTAILLWRLLPRVLLLPSPQQLTAINHQLESQVEERRRKEAELLAAKDHAVNANQAKSLFLATMSHELRTPLNAILGFSQTLSLNLFGPLNERQSDYVRYIRESGEHLLRLINDILDISRIDAGKLSLTLSVVSLGDALESSRVLILDRAREQGVTVTTDVAADLPPVIGDEIRIKQVFLNLLSNAVKFTPKGGSVTVQARSRGLNRVAVCVEDTGIGMAAEDIPKALEMFTQIDDRLIRKYEGAGIGLPLTKALVELHGGLLDIASAPGEGTRVTIIFPAATAERMGAVNNGPELFVSPETP